MLCDDFLDTLNRLLDERSEDRAELLNHTRECTKCRQAWDAFQRCEQTLSRRPLVRSDLSERVIQEARLPYLAPQRTRVVAFVSFALATATALAVLFNSLVNEPTPMPQSREHTISLSHQATETWPRWYASTEFPSVNQLWSDWTDDSTHSAVTDSVSAGFRPVANTMSSAFQAIRQNVLRVPPPAATDVDEQAGYATDRQVA